MKLTKFNKLLEESSKQDIAVPEINVSIHMGNGVVLDVTDIGTDGNGTIYIDCDGRNYLYHLSKKI